MSTDLDIYGSSDLTNAAIDAAQSAMSSRAYTTPKDLEPGTYVFRLVPRPPEDLRAGKTEHFFSFFRHLYEGTPGAKDWVSFACPHRNSARYGGGGTCSSCNQGRELRAKHKRETPGWKRAMDVSADHLVLFNVIDRADPETVITMAITAPVGKPKGRSMFEKLQLAIKNPQLGGDVLHPVTGRDIILTKVRTSAGRDGTEYTWAIARDPSQLHADMSTAMELIRKAPDLEQLITAEVKRGVDRHDELFPAGPADLGAIQSRRVGPRTSAALPAAQTADEDMYAAVDDGDAVEF